MLLRNRVSGPLTLNGYEIRTCDKRIGGGRAG